MNNDLSVLVDPYKHQPLSYNKDKLSYKEKNYPIISGIPRFVDGDNYAQDFGLQWNEFYNTQLDSYTNTDLSESRLKRCLRGELDKIEGKLVLEAGSGAGRFTEVLLKYGSILHSFDYSNAVEANSKNNGSHDNLTLVQADIRSIPYVPAMYDYVICLGVIQHTPNPEESINSLWEMVKPGGYLVIDHYLFKWRYVIPPPFGGSEMLYRKVILKMPQKKRLNAVKKIVDFWFPIHWKYKDNLNIQRVLRRFSPLHFYYPDFNLSGYDANYQWSLLDTHDGLTDYYKHYRTVDQIKNTLSSSLNAEEIYVMKAGNGIEAFCKKSASN